LIDAVYTMMSPSRAKRYDRNIPLRPYRRAHHVISRLQVLAWMRRSFATAFVALGAKLARSGR
jgi:hypothetical protein